MENDAGIHPAPEEFSQAELAADPILHFFHYAHLPPKLQETSKAFFRLARAIVSTVPRNPERTVALRKLLEGKDAAVRANLPVPGFKERVTSATMPEIRDDLEGEAEPVTIGEFDQARDGDPRFND